MTDDWTALSSKRRRAFTNNLVNVYGPRCYICGLPLDPAHATCQHVIPRSKGGLTTVENCRPAHARCNFSVGNRQLNDSPADIVHDGLAAFTRAGFFDENGG